MDVPASVPSLAKLIDINTQWSSQCYWHSKANGRLSEQRCGNFTSVDDVQRRRTLIRTLRGLIPSGNAEANTSSNTARPDGRSQIQEILKELSELLLCKRWHRVKSAIVYAKWSTESEELKKSTSRPMTKDIRKELNIEDGKTLLCQGKTLKGIKCKNWTSAKNREGADAIIEVVAKARDSSPTTRDNITVVAQLLMCQRYHQDQAVGKAEEWFRKIQELFPIAHATPEQASTQRQASTPHQDSTPPFRRTSTRHSETPESAVSSVWSRADSAAVSTPATSPASQRRYAPTSNPPDSPLPPTRATTTNNTNNADPPRVTHNRVTRRTTRQYELGFLPPEPILTNFEEFSPNKSYTFLKELDAKIKRSILRTEKDGGYIYGFQREGEKYIKIGYTKQTIKARMGQWESQCNQKVEVVLDEYMPHAAKVEKLVHLCLHQERRRETRCNAGKGCGTQHIEWFEVALDRAEHMLGVWKKWIETRPYDKGGNLKPVWVKHIDQIRKAKTNSSLESWRDWIDITILAKGTTVEVKTEPVDARQTVPLAAKTKTEIVVTKTEVKDEAKVKVAADVQKLRQELSRLNRGFVESIVKLKDETPEEKPLTDYPAAVQDLSLHMGDPFAASAAPAVAAAAA
jgi:hypothetical protein